MIKIRPRIEVNNGAVENNRGQNNNNQNSIVSNTDLVNYGQPTTVNEFGKRMLIAATEGNVQEIKSLLGRGALFTADWLGTSPLHLAARHNHLEICEILLKAGISRDARTKVDKTSLHLAATHGHVNVVSLLLDYGSERDCKDMLGMTPLHWAVQNCHNDVIQVLVRNGAQVDVVNKFSLTPFDIAAQMDRQDLIDLLTTDPEELANALSPVKVHLIEEDSNISNASESNSSIPLVSETILLEDSESLWTPNKGKFQDPTEMNNHSENTFNASIKLLQEHGITMLPNDEDNILSTVMDNGHSVVLTDVGKEVLNSLKDEEMDFEHKLYNSTQKQFVTLDGTVNMKNLYKQLVGKSAISNKSLKKDYCKNESKRVKVFTAVSETSTDVCDPSATDMETVMKELIEARKTIEEYKIKLHKKEQEVDRYKQQLKLLMEGI